MNEETDFTDEGNSRLDALRHQIAKRRWREELRGTERNGIRWQSDPDGRLAVLESMAFADLSESRGGPPFRTRWKGLGGQWSNELGKKELIEAAAAIGQRRAACFARERELLDQLEADPEQFEETEIGTGWPE